MGLIKLSAGINWSNLLLEWVGLAKLFAGIGGIGQTFCKNGWDWSNFEQEWVGLENLSARVGGIGQTLCRNKLGLVKPSVGIGEICQSFCKNGCDWSNFLQERVGLVKMSWISQAFCRNG